MKGNFSIKDWLGYIGTAIIAVAGVTVWAYSTFDTKDNASSYQLKETASAFNSAVAGRLDRIENKLDRLLMRRNSDGRQ